MKQRPLICTYYFPNWHVDPRNERIHGKNWTEWRVVQYATPRFPGHEQPKIPLWGYDDEANPKDMSRKIKAAADHGIDAFVFDYYYFSDGAYRERCLQEGFLRAPNRNDLQFALMWANHDPIYAHPGSYLKPRDPLWSGKVDAETFIRCTEHCIQSYFREPNYLRVDGKLYFSIFRPAAMIEELGGKYIARLLFEDFRRRVEKAGLGQLMLDGIVINSGSSLDEANSLLLETGFDSASDYGWNGHRDEDFPALDWERWFERCKDDAERISTALQLPYNPVVPMGWDVSPRTVQSDMYDKRDYPFDVVIVNNTPEHYEKALRHVGAFMQSDKATGSIIHLPCWNEWTEGAYLEPDQKHGYGYLEAVKHAFGISLKN